MKPQSPFKRSPVMTPAERVVKDIRRQTRRHFSAEDKVRIVLNGLRGEDIIGAATPPARRLTSTPRQGPQSVKLRRKLRQVVSRRPRCTATGSGAGTSTSSES